MPAPARVFVMCADVVGARAEPSRRAAFLQRLPGLLDAVAGTSLARPFAVARLDEVEGALEIGADPFALIVAAALDARGLPLRWAVVAGEEPAAAEAARLALPELRARRERLAITSGEGRADALLADLAPMLEALLDDMSARQRDIARRILVEGRRQAAVAAELGVSRATISVAVARGRVRDLGRATRGLRALLAEGVSARVAETSGDLPRAAAR